MTHLVESRISKALLIAMALGLGAQAQAADAFVYLCESSDWFGTPPSYFMSECFGAGSTVDAALARCETDWAAELGLTTRPEMGIARIFNSTRHCEEYVSEQLEILGNETGVTVQSVKADGLSTFIFTSHEQDL